MAKRSTDTGLPRNQSPAGKVHLPDPENSGQFDAAVAPDWTCDVKVRDSITGLEHVCDRHDRHDPDPVSTGHYWRELTPPIPADAPTDSFGSVAEGVYVPVRDGDSLVAPHDEAAMADPPATPDASGETPEPSHTPDVAAGSGGRAGRSSEVPARAGTPGEYRDAVAVSGASGLGPTSLVRPDASERVLGAAMGVINPVADPSYAIRHAEEQARVIIIGQHWANMLAAVSPPASRLVDDDDVRGVYLKLRQIAATHGIDLDGGDQ